MRNRKFVATIVKLVVFALASVLLTTVVVTSLLDINTNPTHTYRARFSDAAGLQSADVVRIAGVEVGKVNSIHLVRGAAEVSFSVDAGQHLTTTTVAAIHFENLLGQRFLALVPGAAGGAPLRPGATIPESRTDNGLDLTLLFDGFQPLFSALNPQQVNELTGSLIQVFQGESGTVGDLVHQIATLTGNLVQRQQVINGVIDNLTPLITTVSEHDQQLGNLITEFNTLVSGVAGERGQLGTAIGSVGTLASSLSGVLAQSQPALNNDLSGLTSVTGSLAANQQQIDAALGGLPGFLATVDKVASRGSFLDVYLCNLNLGTSGPIQATLVPGDTATIPVPTGPVGTGAHTVSCQ